MRDENVCVCLHNFRTIPNYSRHILLKPRDFGCSQEGSMSLNNCSFLSAKTFYQRKSNKTFAQDIANETFIRTFYNCLANEERLVYCGMPKVSHNRSLNVMRSVSFFGSW